MSADDLIDTIKNAKKAEDILYALTKPAANEQVFEAALNESARFPEAQDRILEAVAFKTAMPSTLIKCTKGSSDTIINIVNSFHANDEVFEAAINSSMKFLPFSPARENILRAICKRNVSPTILINIISVSKDSKTIMGVINSPCATDEVFGAIIDIVEDIRQSLSESESAQNNFLNGMLVKEKIYKAIIERTMSPDILIRIISLTGYADILLLAVSSPAANEEVLETAINVSKGFSRKIQSDILDYVTSLRQNVDKKIEDEDTGAPKLGR